MSTPKRGNKCRWRGEETPVQFWCGKFGQWFQLSGLECARCAAGKPVTTAAYREALHAVNKVNPVSSVRRGVRP